MDKEIRMLATELELRETEDKKRTISGYAVKWEQLSGKLGWYFRFRERFRKGAFTETLKNDEQKCLWNHNRDIILGSTKNGTLRISEDDIGLRFENDLPESEWGNNVYESIKRKDVEGVSFGFRMLGEEWDEADPDDRIRTVTKAKLGEISPTAFPAYPQSEVQAREMDKVYEEYRAANSKPEPVAEAEARLAAQRQEFRKIKNKVMKIYEEVK